MKNPFHYGGVVTGEDFCNRQKEVSELTRIIENSQKVFVYSERRFGKTSLVQRVLDQLPRKAYLSVYVDLWSTDGEAAFVSAVARAITESMATTADKLVQTARDFFGRLKPGITINDEGRPVITFEASRISDLSSDLEEVLEAPARVAREGKRSVVIVFDEFQQILEYESEQVERRLRSIVQHQRDISYVFLGSRRHLIQKLFLGRSRPLYRAAAHYPLGPIQAEDWLPFIRERFLEARRQITDEQIRRVCRITEGHPFYTQHLCHVLWELCGVGEEVTGDLIQSSVDIVLDRESYAYATLWESLTKNQQRFLKGLAAEAPGVQPFGGDFIQRYGLRSPSNVQRSAAVLLDKDVIDRNNGSYVILDRFFRLWIQKGQTV